MKNSINEVKSALESTGNRADHVEERIESSKTEIQKSFRWKRRNNIQMKNSTRIIQFH